MFGKPNKQASSTEYQLLLRMVVALEETVRLNEKRIEMLEELVIKISDKQEGKYEASDYSN